MAPVSGVLCRGNGMASMPGSMHVAGHGCGPVVEVVDVTLALCSVLCYAMPASFHSSCLKTIESLNKMKKTICLVLLIQNPYLSLPLPPSCRQESQKTDRRGPSSSHIA